VQLFSKGSKALPVTIVTNRIRSFLEFEDQDVWPVDASGMDDQVWDCEDVAILIGFVETELRELESLRIYALAVVFHVHEKFWDIGKQSLKMKSHSGGYAPLAEIVSEEIRIEPQKFR
jgi:hypothetical protein